MHTNSLPSDHGSHILQITREKKTSTVQFYPEIVRTILEYQ